MKLLDRIKQMVTDGFSYDDVGEVLEGALPKLVTVVDAVEKYHQKNIEYLEAGGINSSGNELWEMCEAFEEMIKAKDALMSEENVDDTPGES